MLALLFGFGCASLPDGSEVVPPLESGFECPTVPSGYYAPGSIFSIDGKGRLYRRADLSADPQILKDRKSDIVYASFQFSKQQRMSGNLFFSSLQKAIPGLSAKVESQFSGERVVEMSYGDVRGEVIFDQATNYLRDWFATHIRPEPGNRYFLVREAVLAGEIAYKLTAGDVVSLGGEGKLHELVAGKAYIELHNKNSKFTLSQAFSPRIRVCFKAQEIAYTLAGTRTLMADRGRGRRRGRIVDVRLRSVEDTHVPVIRSVSRAQ